MTSIILIITDWVYKLGPEVKLPNRNMTEYAYAVIGTWLRLPVTVLARDPIDFAKQFHGEVWQWLRDNEFVNDFTQRMQLVKNTNFHRCNYDPEVVKQHMA